MKRHCSGLAWRAPEVAAVTNAPLYSCVDLLLHGRSTDLHTLLQWLVLLLLLVIECRLCCCQGSLLVSNNWCCCGCSHSRW
jgi:hypothetical protein